MNRPGSGQPSPDALFSDWARQRGFRLARDASRRALSGIPGVPWEEHSKVSVAYAASGAQQGLPVLALRVDHRWNTGNSSLNGPASRSKHGHLCVAVVELPSPIPVLGVHKRKDTLTKLGSIKHWGKLFEGAGVEIAGPPEMGRYRVDAKDADFARWFMTPDVFAMMLPPAQDFAREQLVADTTFSAYEFLFEFSGRKIVVWSDARNDRTKANFGVDVLDSCVANALWLYQRIPQQAYGNPAGVEADRAGVPLQELSSRIGV